MKNYILILTIFLLFQNGIKAQNVTEEKTVDNKKILKVEYNEISTFIKSIVNNDKASLYITNDFTFCKTDFNFEDTNSEKINNNLENVATIEADPEDYFCEIYVDRKTNKLTEYLFENKVLKKQFAVKEPLPTMKWEFLNEKKVIGDYTCEKAKTVFRGRIYEVWYTPEIPISSGPWKFNGLPGLILSIKDLDGIYSWEATSIKTINNDEFKLLNHLKNKIKYTEISYKDFDEKVINTRMEGLKVKKSRSDGDFNLNFSTNQDKEPKNEWRDQTNFKL